MKNSLELALFNYLPIALISMLVMLFITAMMLAPYFLPQAAQI